MMDVEFLVALFKNKKEHGTSPHYGDAQSAAVYAEKMMVLNDADSVFVYEQPSGHVVYKRLSRAKRT